MKGKSGRGRIAAAGRRALRALLAAALAASLVPAAALARDGEGPYVGEGTTTLQASSVTVDGTAVTAAALAAALPAMQKAPAPAGGAMGEYAGILAADAAASGSLAQAGSRLSLVFLSASCSLLAAQILSWGDGAAYVIPAGAVEGVGRNIYVVVASPQAVLVDGVPVGACWLQHSLLSYIAANHGSIQAAPEEAELADRAEAARGAFLEMAGQELNSDGRGDILMVSIGYNKVTGKVAVGVKLKAGNSKDGWLAAGGGTLAGGIPYQAVLDDAGSALVSVKKYNCAEDACVSQLGGLAEAEAGNVVMLPPFRVNGPNGGVAAKISVRKVCEECEDAYGRHSFAAGTSFESPTVRKE